MYPAFERLKHSLCMCIERGWKPRGSSNGIDFRDNVFEGRIHFWVIVDYQHYSIHDLFSVDSGLMEFVKRPSEGKMIMVDAEIIEDGEGLPGVDARDSADDTEPKYHYMMMGSLSAYNKMIYFVKNALLPIQQPGTSSEQEN